MTPGELIELKCKIAMVLAIICGLALIIMW